MNFFPISVNEPCFFGMTILDMTLENTEDAMDVAVITDEDEVDDDCDDSSVDPTFLVDILLNRPLIPTSAIGGAT
jgi:hypothetical protein